MTMTSGAADVSTAAIGALPKIKVDGAAFTDADLSSLLLLDIESTTGRPDLCEIRLLQAMDSSATPADDVKAGWAPGKKLEVSWADTDVFKGEITSVDFQGGVGRSTEIVLLAYDERHRMYRTEEVRVFKDQSFQEIVKALLTSAGITGADLSGLPSAAMKYYLHEGSVGDLIERLCDQYGLYCVYENDKVLIKKSSELTEEVGELRGTAELRDFRFRQTTSADRAKAEVRGWDPKQKKEIVGTGTRSAALPAGGLVASTDSAADFKEQTLRHTTYVSAQAEADARAQGALAGNVDAGMQLDATAMLLPKCRAGKLVKVSEVPARFAGKYRLTSVRHHYDTLAGGRTTIACRGADDTSLPGLLQQAVLGGAGAAFGRVGHGLQPAIVKNVKSVTSEGAVGADGAAGEVKVELPWLGEKIESGWLRVVTVGGGKDRGFMVMPEKEDEVLVAFHDDDMRSGYVLGGLYNGKDAAPRKGAKLTDGEKIHERVWRSRKGHEIAIGDKDGEEFLLLKSADTKYMIVLDLKEESIRIESEGAVSITAAKDLSLEAQGEITIKASKDIKMEGANINAKAQQKVAVEGGTQVSIDGKAGAELKGAKVDINAQGPATVKGNPIMLN